MFTQTLLLHDTPLARVEPKTLRYRLLHVAARLTRRQRRLWLRLDRHWPWATHLAARSADWPRWPRPRVDLHAQHDERRELPAEQHAGLIARPAYWCSTTKIN